jgi:uncharacterized protein
MLKKIIIAILLIIFIAVNAFCLYVGNLFYNDAVYLNTNKGISEFSTYNNTFNIKYINNFKQEQVSVTSKYGYKLSGVYLTCPKQAKDTVIIVHCLQGSRWTSMKYAEIYLDKGFNVLVYDSRDHGESGGSNVTYGYCEKYDLDKWVDYVEARNKDGVIGVHGESMGAATALLHSELNEKSKRVKFYVADCAYSDLVNLAETELKNNYDFDNPYIVKPVIFYSSIISFVKSGFTFYDVSPINAVKNVTTPIMFIHGGNDTLVPPAMSKEMYNIKPGAKELLIYPESRHAQSFLYNQNDYRKQVWNFIDKYKLKT